MVAAVDDEQYHGDSPSKTRIVDGRGDVFGNWSTDAESEVVSASEAEQEVLDDPQDTSFTANSAQHGDEDPDLVQELSDIWGTFGAGNQNERVGTP